VNSSNISNIDQKLSNSELVSIDKESDDLNSVFEYQIYYFLKMPKEIKYQKVATKQSTQQKNHSN
jgi:hypothetical protein